MSWKKVLKTELKVLPRRRDRLHEGNRFGHGRNLAALALVTRQLRALVEAKANLCEGLEALSANAPRRSLERVFHGLANDLTCGLSVAAAMRRRGFFPRYYCDLVQAAEASGTLGKVLADLSDDLSNQRSILDEARGWMAYLGAVLAIQMSIVIFFLIKVEPVFTDMLQEFQQEAQEGAATSIARDPLLALVPNGFHWATGSSTHLALYWWVWVDAALSLVVLFFGARYVLQNVPAAAAAVGWALCRTPYLRALVVKRDLARVSLVLERLLGAGVPLASALEDAADIDINPIYAAALERLARRSFEGESLSGAVARESAAMFPAAFRGCVSIGETDGLLPDALGKIGRHYFAEARSCARVLSQVVFPLGLALPALVVFVVNTSFFSQYVSMIQIMLDEL